MEKFCLFIDDEDIRVDIEYIQDQAQKRGYKLSYDLYNPTDEIDDNFNFDIEAIKRKLRENYSTRKIDIIACDYNLDDDHINGVEFANILRQFNKNSSILIYSGNLAKILKDYFEGITEENVTAKISKVRKLITSKIENFVDRDDYINHVIGLLNNNSVELEIEEELLKYSDLKFHHGLTEIRGKKLSEVAEEVSKDSNLGNRFVKDIIERAISHMIDLNSQDD